MAFNAGAVVGRLTLNTEQWQNAINRVKADQKSLQGFILRNQQQIKNLGRNFVIAGAAITGAYTLMTKGAITFESAFAGVRKTVDATEDEFAQLRAELIRMSNEIPVSAAELAGIQEIAGQLGVRGVESLTKFTETVAKIAVTTNLTREAAATDFARIANIMQEPLKNVDRMGASVVDLGNNFATTEAEISAFAQRIAGASKVVKLTTPAIFGISAAFTSVGVRAERGGTAVSKALIKIGEAIKTGNKNLEVFARVSGMTSEQFVKAFEKDAGKAFAIFIEGLGRGGLEAAQILEELELGDQRLKQAFLSVGGAGGIMTEAIKMSSEAWEENTALTEEAEKRFATTASQLKILRNNIVNLAIKIGDLLLPMVNKASQAMSDIVINIQIWVDNNKKLAAILAKVGLAIGILLLGLGAIMVILPTVITAMITLKAVTTGLTISILGLEIALGPIILIIVAVAAAIGLIIVAIIKWKTITNFLKKVWWSFVEGVNYGIKVLLENFKKMVDVMAKLPGKLGAPFKELSKKIEGTIQTLEENIELAEEKLVEVFTESQEEVGEIADTIKAKVEENIEAVKNALQNVMNEITNKATSAGQTVTTVWGDLSERLQSVWSSAVFNMTKGTETFKGFWQATLDVMKRYFIEKFIKKVLDAFFDMIAKMIAKSALSGIPIIGPILGALFQFGGYKPKGIWGIAGEAGPEIVTSPTLLPPNIEAQIIPLTSPAIGGGQTMIDIRNNFYGDIRTEADLDEIAEELGYKIKNAIRS